MRNKKVDLDDADRAPRKKESALAPFTARYAEDTLNPITHQGNTRAVVSSKRAPQEANLDMASGNNSSTRQVLAAVSRKVGDANMAAKLWLLFFANQLQALLSLIALAGGLLLTKDHSVWFERHGKLPVPVFSPQWLCLPAGTTFSQLLTKSPH